MPTRWKSDLLLSECFDFVSDDVDSSAPEISDNWLAIQRPNLSSEAFSSKTPSLYASPKSWCAKQWMLVVFPMPGIPLEDPSVKPIAKVYQLISYRDDDVRTVPILRDDLEPVDRLLVPDNIVQDLRPVLFYPGWAEKPGKHELRETHHGNSYELLFAGAFPFAMEEVICRRRVVSVTCDPNAQHLTRLPEVFAMSSDHASKGSLFATPASATRINKIVFYSKGTAINIPTKTTP